MAVKWTRRSLVLGLAATAGLPSVAHAQSGKSLTIYVGFAAGGAVDLYARLVGKYMAQEMGLAGAIVQNIPGAGSIEAANRLFNAAPKDGLTIGALGRGIVTEPLFENANARYIAAKFNWIGSPSRENATVLSFGNSKFRSLDDLRKFEMKVGATGPGAEGYSFSRVLNEVLGTKLRPILGYTGSADILQALERGEIDGSAGLSWAAAIRGTHPHWVRDKLVNPILQLGQAPFAELEAAPRVMDLIEKPADKQLYAIFASRLDYAFPFVAPPGVAEADVAKLRASFDKAVKNPEFLSEAAKIALDVNPLSGEQMTVLIDNIFKSDPATLQRAASIMKP